MSQLRPAGYADADQPGLHGSLFGRSLVVPAGGDPGVSGHLLLPRALLGL